jgi:hypothetical protein
VQHSVAVRVEAQAGHGQRETAAETLRRKREERERLVPTPEKPREDDEW